VIYCIDIDGTLCSLTDGNYSEATPYTERVQVVNNLYDGGHTIFLYTARGSLSGIDWESDTRRQLKEWGVKYHQLSLGKPHYDVWVDDKAVSDRDFF
jgi:hypothetical protein